MGVKSCAVRVRSADSAASLLSRAELGGGELPADGWDFRESQEVGEEPFSGCGSDRLGVELDAVDRKTPVTKGHDLLSGRPVVGPGGDLQARRKAIRRHHQGMVAHDLMG
jgi:hypothetical protein